MLPNPETRNPGLQHRSKWDTLPYWCTTWPKAHIGRYWKRQLSKARRRHAKTGRPGGLLHYEGMCNYKTW